MMIKEVPYYEKTETEALVCRLCPAECRLTPGKRGICRSRYQDDGKIVTDNYGELVTVAVDPIEKKPLYHFYPGTQILSTGANCCNLACRHCQNWTISQEKAPTSYCPPENLPSIARDHESIGVAFTYTEPLMWYEYIMDTAPLLKQAGLKVVLVSNGYINPEPLEELLPYVDAANIDLKGMRPEFYKRVCKGRLEPILDNLKRMAGSDVHLEITNLIIPDENDSEDEIRQLIDFVAELGKNVPLHFSAYHPDYQMDRPGTPAVTLRRAYDMAREKLNHVFIGNMRIPGFSDSFCPNCGVTLVERSGFRPEIKNLRGGECTACGAQTGIRQ